MLAFTKWQGNLFPLLELEVEPDNAHVEIRYLWNLSMMGNDRYGITSTVCPVLH